jgi:hypothetical protein
VDRSIFTNEFVRDGILVNVLGIDRAAHHAANRAVATDGTTEGPGISADDGVVLDVPFASGVALARATKFGQRCGHDRVSSCNVCVEMKGYDRFVG